VAAAAGGADLPSYGVAVTSLGSTLAMKMLSRTFVEDSQRGVYSHRFPVLGRKRAKDDEGGEEHEHENGGEQQEEEAWLVGGASNVGCAVLRKENFSTEELIELSRDMDVSTDSSFDYYPLTKVGERFPVADGTKEPIMEPKPDSRGEYLKGIFQGISNVERMGFDVLGELGASPAFPNVVWTCGGGSKNDAWLRQRERLLQQRQRQGGTCADDPVRVMRADNAEASFGAAILAASSFS